MGRYSVMAQGCDSCFSIGSISFILDQLKRNLIDCDEIIDRYQDGIEFHRDKSWSNEEKVFIQNYLVPWTFLCFFYSKHINT